MIFRLHINKVLLISIYRVPDLFEMVFSVKSYIQLKIATKMIISEPIPAKVLALLQELELDWGYLFKGMIPIYVFKIQNPGFHLFTFSMETVFCIFKISFVHVFNGNCLEKNKKNKKQFPLKT